MPDRDTTGVCRLREETMTEREIYIFKRMGG